MAHRIIESLRQVTPRNAAKVGVSHLFLLFACLWGGLPYLFLQTLLAIELLLISLATIPLYPERGTLKHFLDVLKLIAGLTFAMAFTVAGYGIAQSGDSAYTKTILTGLSEIGLADYAWALGYLIIHVLISLRTALRSKDPRLAWARLSLCGAATTFIALFLMIFVAFFAARPIVWGFASLGAHVNVDTVMSSLMIAVRFVIALIMTLMTESELETIAHAPYRDK